MVAVILVDSNVWIFAENASADEHGIAARKVQRILGELGYGINAIVVAKVYHALSRLLGSADAASRVSNILSHPAGEWLTYKRETAARGVVLASRCQLRINDALIAQQALEKKAPILTDNVRDFRKVRGLRVIGLR